MKTNRWVNDSYGPNGIFLWVILASWFVVLYTVYYWITNINLFELEKSIDLFIIDILVLVVEISLVTFFLFFFFQCIRTVENICFDDDIHVSAKLFYGRNIKFNIDSIKTISPFIAKGIKSIYTPFESKKDNYRIDFKDGSHIFISGSMKDIPKLIEELGRNQ